MARGRVEKRGKCGLVVHAETGADATRGTWILKNSEARNLSPGSLSLQPTAFTETEGGEVPTSWRVQLPEEALDVTIEAVNPQSWMATTVPYWEGPVRVSGSHSGVGYLEMTGYE